MVEPEPILVLILVFSLYGAEAQSPIQPATTPLGSFPNTMWDLSSVGVIIGALIGTLMLFFLFLVFLRWLAQSHGGGEESSRFEGGVHPQLLQTFPILCYSSLKNHINEEAEGPLQCAVCLTDFDHRDTLRLIPQCNHVFHPPCIDAWLSCHVTCPVCRANLNHSHHFTVSIDAETNNAAQGSPINGGEEDKGERERASKLKLSRSNSTGHSVVEVERYTLRLPEDVKKRIMEGVVPPVQRSASYNFVGSSMRGFCWSDSEGSSRGKSYGFGSTGKNLR